MKVNYYLEKLWKYLNFMIKNDGDFSKGCCLDVFRGVVFFVFLGYSVYNFRFMVDK